MRNLLLPTLYLSLMAASLLCFALGMARQKGKTPVSTNLLVVYLGLSFTVECIGLYLGGESQFNHQYFNVYFWVANPLMFLYFGYLLQPLKKAAWVASGLYLLFAFGNYFLLQGAGQFNSYNVMVAAVVVIVFSLLYYLHLLKHPTDKLLTNCDFFAVTAFLFFFATHFMYFLFFDALLRFDNEVAFYLVDVLKVCNLITYAVLFWASICFWRRAAI